MSLIVYIGNDNVLELDGLVNVATGAYDNAATVTVTVVDVSGTEVTGQIWPETMAHVTESPDQGLYRATLENDIAIYAGGKYTAQITATGSGGERGYWEVPLRPQTRVD